MNTTVLNVTHLNVTELNVTRLNTEGIEVVKGKGFPTDLTPDLLTEQGGFFRLENGEKILLEKE